MKVTITSGLHKGRDGLLTGAVKVVNRQEYQEVRLLKTRSCKKEIREFLPTKQITKIN